MNYKFKIKQNRHSVQFHQKTQARSPAKLTPGLDESGDLDRMNSPAHPASTNSLERFKSLDGKHPYHNSINSAKIDRIRLVGNQKSTGRFRNGDKVPRSRPTLFWEPQEYEMPFNYGEFILKKEQRDQRHQLKLDMAQEKKRAVA